MSEELADAEFASGNATTQEIYAETSYRKFFMIDGFNTFKLHLLEKDGVGEGMTKKELGNIAFMALHAPLPHRKNWLVALIQSTEIVKKRAGSAQLAD